MKMQGAWSQESGVGNGFTCCEYPERGPRLRRWFVEEERRRPPAATFEDLIVWQKAHAWVLSIYRLTEAFPVTERYGRTAQFRRAAVSLPANIAEGFRKSGVADKKRFMNIAQGSIEECRYYLILARDLGYGNPEAAMVQLQEVSRLLDAYTKAIRIPGILTPDS